MTLDGDRQGGEFGVALGMSELFLCLELFDVELAVVSTSLPAGSCSRR